MARVLDRSSHVLPHCLGYGASVSAAAHRCELLLLLRMSFLFLFLFLMHARMSTSSFTDIVQGTTIMQGAGISNSFVTQVILGAVNFGTTFGGLYVVENFGRRKSLIVGASFMFACFMAFASVGHFVFDHVEPTNTPGAGKGMVVLACLFITGKLTVRYPTL